MPLLYIVSFKEFESLVCFWHDVKLRKTQLEVRSLTATWSRDLWGHRVVVFFLEMCQIVGWTAMANLAALSAAVFFAICEKPYGGGGWNQPPLPPVRGISSPSKAKNTCSYIIKNANAWLSIKHKEIEFRADHGNDQFARTRFESKGSKTSPTRSQPKEMRPKQSALLAWKLTRL